MVFATKQEIEEIIEKIKEEIEEDRLIILVEGKKDKAALMHLDIKEKVFILNGKDIWNRLEEIANKNQKKHILILTDFDKEGKKLYGKIIKDCERLGMKIDKKYREFFQKRTKVSQIEGLDTYVENIA
ncbi:toprim domain-containing protein [Candidatus Woesearchaeota archaeon]|nr:toprim domain-containing protein [Candidatus Woesearchaeota archaeon]